MIHGYDDTMPEIPETATAVVDYLKEEFEGCEVVSLPEEVRPEIFPFKVTCGNKSYVLEVASECLDDFSWSELLSRLRSYDAAGAMRRSATGNAGFNTVGVSVGIPLK